MPSSTDISADELKVFLQEAEGLLDLLDEDIIRLEQEATNGDLLQEIFRAAHTMKGSSGMLGFQEMTKLTHAMEDLLDRVRKGSLAVTAELVDALLMSLDALKVLKNDLATGQQTAPQVAPIVSALHTAAEAGAVAAGEGDASTLTLDGLVLGDAAIAARLDAAVSSGVPLLRSAQIDPESEWASVRCFQVLNELSSVGELIVSVPTQQQIEQEQAGHSIDAVVATQRQPDELRPAIEAVADITAVAIASWNGPSEEAAAAQPESATAPPATPLPAAHDGAAKIEALSQSVRVDVEVLDELMNLVGELVIDRTRVGQITRVLSSRYKEDGEVRALGETSTHIIKVVDELHESMMQVRMLPVGVLFSKFPRLVRDLSRGMGKDVSLVVDGEDTEIDRSVIEEIKDPLVHLIRNAIDHGVETAAERTAVGKPETAVVLTCPPRTGPSTELENLCRCGRRGRGMSKRKWYAAEEIIAKLREAEVHLAQGDTVGQAVRKLGVSEQTYYRWRREYGGMRVDQAKRLKELERENARLKQLVAEQALDNSILREVASGNF